MTAFQAFPLALLAVAPVRSLILIVVCALAGVAILVPILAIVFIIWMDSRHAEADLKLLYPDEPETTDADAAGKRSGQFGIFDLLVLMTVAGVACAIIRLPIDALLKIFALMAVWFGFAYWIRGKPDARQARRLSYKRRLAVLNAVGSLVIYSPYIWLHFFQRPSRHFYVDLGFVLFVMLLGPIPAIWRAVSAVRAEFAVARRKHEALP